uniref:Alpha-tocopherol transfer protein-like n=1 Tax=Cacopsylla melanoneura TaxID=428564 RepID=A0A8D8YZN3_9HEMI
MTKSSKEDTSVESSISKETQEIAKDELREDQAAREDGLTQLRQWIKKNDRIETCRMDPSFLLRFLRSKKFSIPMAEEALERYLLLRTTYGDMAFTKLDPKNPTMQELLDSGYLFATPKRDALGRRVIVARPGVFHPHKYNNAHMLQIHGMTYETLMEDEENQVRGFVHFNDGAGVSFPHLTLFTPKEAVRIVKNGERTLPMRHKEVHIINCHASVKYALEFGFSLVSEKIRNRIKLYSSIDEAHKHIDKSILPKEYGGEMPMAEMISLWKKELESNVHILRKNDDCLRVRAELYSENARQGAVRALKANCGRLDQDIMAGSFRKLTVD